MKILKEFKEFAVKGNMIDLAIGIIIGSAFGKIVSSLVNDVIMPPLGAVIGGVNFTDIKIKLKDAIIDSAGKNIPAVYLNIGTFIQMCFDFLIIATAVFLLVKAINAFRKKQDEVAPEPTVSEQLLTEIRDLLKDKGENI